MKLNLFQGILNCNEPMLNQKKLSQNFHIQAAAFQLRVWTELPIMQR